MSSQATNEDCDQILTSNDRMSKDETILVSDLDNDYDTQLFDVCVDCYQMINGVKVSMNNLNSKTTDPKLNKQKTMTTRNDSPSIKSPNDITMLTMTHITNVNSNQSPFFNKIIASSHHSTPTSMTTPKLKNDSNNLSSLILNEISSEFDLYNEQEKICRQNLRLDLKPVYSKTSS